MNMTTLINDYKLQYGLQTLALPFDKPIEEVLRETLEGTIRTYSHFKPWIKECYENLSNLKSPNEYDKKFNIYFIPASLTTTPVHDCYAYICSGAYQDSKSSTNAFTVGSPFVGFGSYMPQDILDATSTGAAINKYAGITSQPCTCKWLGANKIQLFNVPIKSLLRFVAKCTHDLNGETIEESCVESFKELAKLDIEMMLYNNLVNFDNVGGALKQIKLPIERWSGASDKRDALLEKWTESFHLDEHDLIQFF